MRAREKASGGNANMTRCFLFCQKLSVCVQLFCVWSEIPSVWCKFVLWLSAFIRGPFTKITCEISLFLLRAGMHTQKAILNFLACAHRHCVIPPQFVSHKNSRFTSRSENLENKFLRSAELRKDLKRRKIYLFLPKKTCEFVSVWSFPNLIPEFNSHV